MTELAETQTWIEDDPPIRHMGQMVHTVVPEEQRVGMKHFYNGMKKEYKFQSEQERADVERVISTLTRVISALVEGAVNGKDELKFRASAKKQLERKTKLSSGRTAQIREVRYRGIRKTF